MRNWHQGRKGPVYDQFSSYHTYEELTPDTLWHNIHQAYSRTIPMRNWHLIGMMSWLLVIVVPYLWGIDTGNGSFDFTADCTAVIPYLWGSDTIKSMFWINSLFTSYHTYKESKPSDYLAVFSCNKSAQIQKRGANHLPPKKKLPQLRNKILLTNKITLL